MRRFISLAVAIFPALLYSQDISILNGWKFSRGDNMNWSSPGYNDSAWTRISVGSPWEDQGYPDYDGFAWYRLHVVIPSSIKDKAYLKEKLRFDLGKIDDGDEFYFNGMLVGRNGGGSGDIKNGRYDVQRSYQIPLTDRSINWDKENLIAVRVWDGGGAGGLYEGQYGISVVDLPDFVRIDDAAHFFLGTERRVSKQISLRSTSDKYDFAGKLRITVTDPQTGALIYKQNLGIDFASKRPFEYTWQTQLPENKSYLATYSFVEARSQKTVTISEAIPYILTPRASAAPRINGPGAIGVRPGSPLQYLIPASGEQPMSVEASGLPAGLSLDKSSGVISGQLTKPGTYVVKLGAKNKVGAAVRTIKIICGSTIGLAPCLGWNSWNCWGLSVSDEKVRASAKAMKEKLAAYGWTYINIDDGWEAGRDAQGKILVNNKFPDMKALADYVHGLGLKLGIYSSPGPLTCGGFTGSYQHEQQDADTYAHWGIDYLKYDWCSYGHIAPAHPSLDDFKKPYQVMRTALDKNQRDIIFSFCQYGMGEVWKWGAETGGNSWRTTGDITDSWNSLSSIGFSQGPCAPYTEPGHFNDPDMLVVGRVGWGPSLHATRLSPDEQYTHISLWCLLSAPLLIGCDMSQLDDFTLNLLTNQEVLAVNQDVLAKPAQKVWDSAGVQAWIKPLEDGSVALGLFNLSDEFMRSELPLAVLRMSPYIRVRDLWRQQDLGRVSGRLSAALPAHGALMLKVRKSD